MEHSEKFLRIVEEAKSRIVEIGPAEVKRKLDSGEHFHLVDVREESEWVEGRVPGARHLGKGILERDIEKAIPDPDAEIVLYCGGGFRSVLAADNLRKMGYSRVFSMAEGWRGWNAAGYPVAK
jgi:rhodanese-related sulfurtransferase